MFPHRCQSWCALHWHRAVPPCRRIAVPLRVSGCHCFSNYPVEAERRALERSSISSNFAIEIIWRHGLRLSLILLYYDTGTLPLPTSFLIDLNYYNFLLFNVIKSTRFRLSSMLSFRSCRLYDTSTMRPG